MSKVYIEKEALLNEFHSLCGSQTGDGWDNWGVEALICRQKPADVVARDCFDKILAENDIMREQLAGIGKKLGDDMRDVKPVARGEWRCTDDLFELAICSICGWETDEPFGYIVGKHNYCPNCGAKMRKEAKDVGDKEQTH